MIFATATGQARGPKVFVRGQSVSWQAPPLYRVYGGGLSPALFQATLSKLGEAFRRWSAVPTAAAPTPAYVGVLTQPIDTDSQLIEFKYGPADGRRRTELTAGPSAVIFASEQLMRELTKLPYDLRDVTGATELAYDTDGDLTRFVTIIGPENDDRRLESVLLHEAGHVLGLDHSQWGTSGDPLPRSLRPTMFPLTVVRNTLYEDDESWISYLYPGKLRDSAFVRFHGVVEQMQSSEGRGGQALKQFRPLLGEANVVARAIRIDGVPEAALDRYKYSCIADYLGNGTGEFDLWVKPGTYEVFVEPRDPSFRGPSSVGPYSPKLLNGVTAGERFVIEITKETTRRFQLP